MRTVFLDDIGQVILRKSGKAKRVSIRITQDASVEVVVPKRTPYAIAHAFAIRQKEWIHKHKHEAERKKTIFRDEMIIGNRYQVSIQPATHRKRASHQRSGQSIRIMLPSDMAPESADGQAYIRSAAKHVLPERLTLLAQTFGFSYKDVRIKNLRSRWGSCSSNKNINLNLHLMRLPEELIDYVILHELCRTKHLIHSTRFWQLLMSIEPNARQLARSLHAHKTQL